LDSNADCDGICISYSLHDADCVAFYGQHAEWNRKQYRGVNQYTDADSDDDADQYTHCYRYEYSDNDRKRIRYIIRVGYTVYDLHNYVYAFADDFKHADANKFRHVIGDNHGDTKRFQHIYRNANGNVIAVSDFLNDQYLDGICVGLLDTVFQWDCIRNADNYSDTFRNTNVQHV
jgi:hypothetical protein